MDYHFELNQAIKSQKLAKEPEISIILPCRNEEKALPLCLKKINQIIKENNLNAEIIVSDSSWDNSPNIAKSFENTRLIKHDKKGYGIAYIEGFNAAKGKYIFMADADCTYDFNEIPKFISYLKQGYDFVMGDRFAYPFEKGVMSFSHRYIGNPILSTMLRILFGTTVKDSHCGMRAITKSAYNQLKLKTPGMEYASEMVIKAVKNKLKIKELPIHYHKREGDSKLETMKDGWRHLRFMLLYSPLFLFFIPGIIAFILGISLGSWMYFGTAKIFGLTLIHHPMFIASLLTIMGYQLIFFGIFIKTYAIIHLEERSRVLKTLQRKINLESGLIFGSFLILSGIIIYLLILIKWINADFGTLNQFNNAIIALTLLSLGIQTIFSSFMLSIIGIEEK
ncbi:glycosyltransferase family 2 protein [archaeon]|jgi:glycosyltransferase involved in cell wall biosynthesis|nr:glycosyltransferase family 2 protein [archaeon]MBT4241366.1 glycosyltransferase family 2 protein [archaeon]MBT4418187.1 glycosyltransferase family 2 protein [archaeon]